MVHLRLKFSLMYENKIYLSLISHVTTTVVRTWLIFMCYYIENRNCSVSSQLRINDEM